MSTTRENLPLTAIRGLAACWIVLHHVQPLWWPNLASGVAASLAVGRSAVDIFFVLSGFILYRVYGGLHAQAVPLFLLRRICRVFPLHVAVLGGLGLLAAAAEVWGNSPRHEWGEFPIVAMLLQSFLLDHISWNAPTWSVGVELLCYGLFPLTSVLVAGANKRWLIAATALLILAEVCVLRRYDGTVVGVGAALRALAGFSVGVALSRLSESLSPRAGPLLANIGMICVLLCIWGSDVSGIALSAATLIAGLSTERGWLSHVLSWPPFVWLGRVSFALYLLHAPLIGVLNRPSFSPAMRVALLTILLPTLAHAAHILIERPGRMLPDRFGRGRRVATAGPAPAAS